MKVRKAVIPAAGLGTRMLPATKTVPKEMLPIVDRPAIHFIVEEAVRALEADSVITDALGTHVTEQYLAGKRRECRSYAAQVSQWELEQYLVTY